LSLRERQLSKNKNYVAVVRCAEPVKRTLLPNESITVKGVIDRAQSYHATCTLLQPLRNFYEDLDLAPSLVSYNGRDTGSVEVTFHNLSTKTVTLNPRSLLCGLQLVDITALEDLPTHEQKDIMAQVNIDKDHLSAGQLKLVQDFVGHWHHVFFQNKDDIGLCSKVKHRVDLHDEVPFKQRHRMIPPSVLDEVRSHIQQLLAAGIIRRSNSPWSSNIVLARRKDGRLRLCTDFRQVNERTIRGSYALPRVEEILDCLAGSQYFSVLDMK
jgi:hypothetical protein